MDESVPPGVVLRCRLVGVIEAEQQKPKQKRVRNDRFLLVATTSRKRG
jgi:inorganic pyrophosphatase